MKHKKLSLIIALLALIISGGIGSASYVSADSATTTLTDRPCQDRPRHEGNPGIMGEVASINGTTLTVNAKGFGPNAEETVYTVDASSATVKKFEKSSDGKPADTTIALSDINVGDRVMVKGTVSDKNVAAEEIATGMPEPQGQPGENSKQPPMPFDQNQNINK